MKKLLQINITANYCSHGIIAEKIGEIAMSHGWESYMAYGRVCRGSSSISYHIGSMADEIIHGISSRIFDNHGLMSKSATKKLITFINEIDPDIIHLHNIHGYYLNYPLLFEFLSRSNISVVWTLHDCWSFTGHCAHYMYAACDKWKSHCENCPAKKSYPRSIGCDRSYKNFDEKCQSFLSLKNITLVPVSKWLENEIKQSFLKNLNTVQIYNGIDLDVFKHRADIFATKHKYGIKENAKIVLGVASNWYHKGLDDLFKISYMLPTDYTVLIVGLNEKELHKIPNNKIIGIKRTNDINELVSLYSMADVYVNTTYEDTFPTTNIEAMACETPIVTYDTGGCREAVNSQTGIVVKKGCINDIVRNIIDFCGNNLKEQFAKSCRQRCIDLFDMNKNFQRYFQLYNDILYNSN